MSKTLEEAKHVLGKRRYQSQHSGRWCRRSTQRERVEGDIIGRIMAAAAAKLKNKQAYRRNKDKNQGRREGGREKIKIHEVEIYWRNGRRLEYFISWSAESRKWSWPIRRARRRRNYASSHFDGIEIEL
jgi:hypothetical protein